jgi:hypothetical protein
VIFEKYAKLHSPRRLVQFWHIFLISLVVLIINCTPSRVITYTYDLIFIYENSYMKLPNFSVKSISYMKFSFSYVNCITSYMTWFSYMKILIWNYQISHVKWISYMKIFFSYVNCITSYMTWFSYMKILIWNCQISVWNGFHTWNLVFHMWIV